MSIINTGPAKVGGSQKELGGKLSSARRFARASWANALLICIIGCVRRLCGNISAVAKTGQVGIEASVNRLCQLIYRVSSAVLRPGGFNPNLSFVMHARAYWHSAGRGCRGPWDGCASINNWRCVVEIFHSLEQLKYFFVGPFAIAAQPHGSRESIQ